MFERNDQEISQIIEENLEGILSGKTSIEELSRRFPRHAAELRRELEAALWLNSRRDQVKSRPGFIQASRGRVVARIKQEAHRKNEKHSLLSFPWTFQSRVYQWAAVLVILVLLLSSGGGVVSFAQSALPGQNLYGIKRGTENLAMGLAFSTINKVELRIEFTDRRFQEVEALVDAGDMAFVETTLDQFNSGVKESMTLIDQVSDSMPAEKLILAEQLTANLEDKADRLEVLSQHAPAEIQSDIIAARALTLTGASSMMLVMDEINEILSTSTPARTNTPKKSTQDLTITATLAVEPGLTPKPKEVDGNTGKPELARTPPGLENKKPTHTPRPTNSNRPTDSSINPTKTPDPTKDDKPTKDKLDKDK